MSDPTQVTINFNLHGSAVLASVPAVAVPGDDAGNLTPHTLTFQNPDPHWLLEDLKIAMVSLSMAIDKLEAGS